MNHDVIEALREGASGRDNVGIDIDQIVTRGRARRRRRTWVRVGSATISSAAVLALALGMGQRFAPTQSSDSNGDRLAATRSASPSTHQGAQWSGVDWGVCTKDFSNRSGLIRQGIMPYWLHLRAEIDPTAEHFDCEGVMGGSPGHGMLWGGYYSIGRKTAEIVVAAFTEDEQNGTYAETYSPEPCGTNSQLFYGDLTCETIPDPAGGQLAYGEHNGPHGYTRVASYHAPDGKVVIFSYSPDLDFHNLADNRPMTTTPVTRQQALSVVTDPFYRHW